MPFYLRKAISVGPLRFNLSKSGVGISVGVRGLRLGSGARGNYVHAGRAGFYYRKTLPGEPVGSATVFKDIARQIHPSTPDSGGARATEVDAPDVVTLESGSALQMVDANSEELLRELNMKRAHSDKWPWLAGVTGIVVVVSILGGITSWIWICVALLGGALTFWRNEKDQIERFAVSMYEFEEGSEARFRDLCSVFDELISALGVWHVASERAGSSSKEESGASSAVSRGRIAVSLGTGPAHLKTNVPVPQIPVGLQKLHFLPDQILVEAPEGYGAVRYSNLAITVTQDRFIEKGVLPSDAKVVDKTWMYVNKSGEPDRRFKDNREIPVVLYERIQFKSPSGLLEAIQVSRLGLGEKLKQALAGLR